MYFGFFSFSSSRGFHSHSASLHAHDALSRYAAKAQLRFASKLARTVMLRLRTFFFSFSSSRSFHSHSASLHAHDALSRYAAKAQLRFASKLARAVMLRLRTFFFLSLPPAVSIRIPLLSMLMTRCRAIQPKHNSALQASLHALLCFVCAPLVGICKL